MLGINESCHHIQDRGKALLDLLAPAAQDWKASPCLLEVMCDSN